MRTAIVPLSGEIYLDVTAGGTPSTGGRCLVVFDAGHGNETESFEVQFNGTLRSVPTPSAWGYFFSGWLNPDGTPFDPSEPIKSSVVLTALWGKQNSMDSTPIYLGAIFLASIVATFAVLAVGRRMRS